MDILERLRELATAIALNSDMETKHGETADLAYDVISTKFKKAIQLLRESVDDENCQLDHHGHCQTHNWFSEIKCINKRIQEFLEAVK